MFIPWLLLSVRSKCDQMKLLPIRIKISDFFVVNWFIIGSNKLEKVFFLNLEIKFTWESSLSEDLWRWTSKMFCSRARIFRSKAWVFSVVFCSFSAADLSSDSRCLTLTTNPLFSSSSFSTNDDWPTVFDPFFVAPPAKENYYFLNNL